MSNVSIWVDNQRNSEKNKGKINIQKKLNRPPISKLTIQLGF